MIPAASIDATHGSARGLSPLCFLWLCVLREVRDGHKRRKRRWARTTLYLASIDAAKLIGRASGGGGLRTNWSANSAPFRGAFAGSAGLEPSAPDFTGRRGDPKYRLEQALGAAVQEEFPRGGYDHPVNVSTQPMMKVLPVER